MDNESKYRKAMKERYDHQLDTLDPIKKKFVHLTVVIDFITDDYKVYEKNLRESAERDDTVQRAANIFLVQMQHMDMLIDKISDLHNKYIKDECIIEKFSDKVIMRAWMNIVVMCMHITRGVLPIINVLNGNKITIEGDKTLAEDFKEFLSVMKYLINMDEDFEEYMNKNMNY